jgi:hypothetical protein
MFGNFGSATVHTIPRLEFAPSRGGAGKDSWLRHSVEVMFAWKWRQKVRAALGSPGKLPQAAADKLIFLNKLQIFANQLHFPLEIDLHLNADFFGPICMGLY